MNAARGLRAIAAAFLVISLSPVAAAQDPQTPRDRVLTQARQALAAGRATEALRTIEPLLAQAPGDRELAELSILANLALDDRARAYASYDGYVLTTGIPDARLLKPLALRELQAAVAESEYDPRLRADALERMARGGDPRAANDLRQGDARHPRLGLLADTALARLGDDAARKRIAEAVTSSDFADKIPVAEAIRRSGDASQGPLLAQLLGHRDPFVRAAAVEGLGALGYTGAIPEMRALVNDPYIEVRGKAALALTKLGDPSGRSIVNSMLASPVPDVRLRAIEADPTISLAERSGMIRAILVDPDPLNRVKAAEALARDEPDAAKPVLVALLKDPDSTPRREAARVLERPIFSDLELYRQMLSDRDPWVRMHGAGGVIQAGGSGAPAVLER